ncbi:hypothetical protein I302_107925 [Kwoniella bestiolae CBS 10118]|uniref:Transcription factor domain-containing protein n=1 Tax=Kwoniella bestiolae CBS 10118 TaxID=1296100 RepID=A0A1B9FX62_9TREE|nr:hypothetical protein I302_07711 [Kwoniella bestiolae CBS 10118]OCF23357.1 hypothetical protein I302_07711 [Kwoniella bestiolae CBS 10118]
MRDLAMIMYDFSTSSLPRIQALSAAEARMQELLQRQPVASTLDPRFVWSRHVFVICVHHRRLVLHRPYFARSYREAGFDTAQRICLDAAQAVIAERRRAVPSSYERVWSVMMQTLAAAVILIIDFFHDDSPTEVLDAKRPQIQQLLHVFSHGVEAQPYVQRAMPLLVSLLREEEQFRSQYRERRAQSHHAQQAAQTNLVDNGTSGNPITDQQRAVLAGGWNNLQGMYGHDSSSQVFPGVSGHGMTTLQSTLGPDASLLDSDILAFLQPTE